MFKYSKLLPICIIINLFNINIAQASVKRSAKVWTPVDASRSARLGSGWQSNETMRASSGALVSEVDRASALTASERIALLNGSRSFPATPSADGSVIVTVGHQAGNGRIVGSSQDLVPQNSAETFSILNTQKPEKSKIVRVQKNRTLKRGEFERLATLKKGEFERLVSSENTNNTPPIETEKTSTSSSTGKLESTVSPQLAYRIDQWVQGNISDSKMLKAMAREEAYSSDSSFLRALDNIDSHYDIGSIDVTMNTDALHKLNNVTGKRSGLAAVEYCIEHGIYCGGNGGDDGSPPPPPPPHDDHAIAGMSNTEQKHLFIATLHDIYEEDKDAAVRLVNDRHTEHKTLDLYDEIPDIIGAVTNHRSQGHVVSVIGQA